MGFGTILINLMKYKKNRCLRLIKWYLCFRDAAMGNEVTVRAAKDRQLERASK